MLRSGFARAATLEALEVRRLLSAGDVDSSFGVNGSVDLARGIASSTQATILPLSGGKFLTLLISSPTTGQNVIQCRNADGSLDATFGPAEVAGEADYAFRGITDAAVAADGKIVIAHYGNSVAQLVRLNGDGTLDDTFGEGGVVDLRAATGGDGYVYDLALKHDGAIVILGSHWHVYQITSAGAVDGSFHDFDFTSDVASGSLPQISTTGDDKIVIGGANFSHEGHRFDFVRLAGDGTPDTTFAAGGYFDGFNTSGFAVQDDGRILVGYLGDGRTSVHVQRLSTTGTVESSYHPVMRFGKLKGRTHFAFAGDGHVIVYTNWSIARLNSDGGVDSDFGRIGTYDWDGSLNVGGAMVQANGDVLVAAGMSFSDGRLYRLHGSDAPESPFAQLDNAGTLSITGSSGGDGYYVQGTTNGLFVHTRGGFGRAFAANDVRHINVTLDDGNDHFVLVGTTVPLRVSGGDGSDTIRTGDGDDSILGDAGRDYIFAGGGNDTILGGANADWLDGSAGDDQIDGNGGNDRITGGAGADTLHGNAGDDTFCTIDSTIDQIFGEGGGDIAVCDAQDLAESLARWL